MKTYHPLKSFQKGLTLVEVLLAVAVGSMLLVGLSQIFIGNKATYRIQEGLSRLQENARYVFEVLSKDIRMANYLGCAQRNYSMDDMLVSSAYRNILNDAEDSIWDFRRGIEGFEATGGGFSPSLHPSINDVDEDSDVISIKVVRGSGLRLSSDIEQTKDDDDDSEAPGTIQVTVNDVTPLNDEDIAIITDCTTTTVFQVTDYDKKTGIIEHSDNNALEPGNSKPSLEYPFLAGAMVFPSETVTYFVRKGALFRQINDKSSDSLIEGVENIQITYGVDLVNNDERADAYLTADEVDTLEDPDDPLKSWRRVVSVRIGLLMRTIEKVNSEIDKSTYTVNNEPAINPSNDRRLRRVFHTNVALRNRLP